MKKVLIIISTSDEEKARTGAMYAKNALLNKWVEDVKVFIFGPAQSILLKDEELRDFVAEMQAMDANPVACQFISDRDKNTEQLEKLGIDVHR